MSAITDQVSTDVAEYSDTIEPICSKCVALTAEIAALKNEMLIITTNHDVQMQIVHREIAQKDSEIKKLNEKYNKQYQEFEQGRKCSSVQFEVNRYVFLFIIIISA